MDSSTAPHTLRFNRIMLLRLETSVHSADVVSTGDIELSTVDVYIFSLLSYRAVIQLHSESK